MNAAKPRVGRLKSFFDVLSIFSGEAVTAAWLLRRFAGIDESAERFKPALGLVVFGALLSTAVSATIGVTSFCVGNVHHGLRRGQDLARDG